jgi:hypothetical protein
MANVLHPDEDWQSRRSVIECNKHMLAQQLGCDVTFNIVRGETVQIRAHKYVLGSRSCVFYAMFYGPLSENTGTEIDIPDMTPEQFNDLLQYVFLCPPPPPSISFLIAHPSVCLCFLTRS